MNKLNNELLRCMQIFENRRAFYESMIVKIAAINYEGTWHNLVTLLLLSSEKASETIEKKVDLDDFFILHATKRADTFLEVLENLEKDSFELDGVPIEYFSKQTPPLRFEDRLSGSSSSAKERFQFEWPLYIFRWQQNHKLQNKLRNILEPISLRLNCYIPPYEDVYHAVREFIEVPEYYFSEYGSLYSSCDILMPEYIAIKKCNLEGNSFEIEAKFHNSINIDDLRLSLIVYGKTTERFHEDFKGITPKDEPPFKVANKTLTLKEAAEVKAYLFLKNREQYGSSDQVLIRNRKSTLNILLTAHAVFDEDSKGLRRQLSRRRDFEYAVATLLHLCGFYTERTGRLSGELPDILAFSPDKMALIVGECTTKAPEINKIMDLKKRANKLKRELKIDVYPILFTSVKRQDVKSGRPEAIAAPEATIVYFDRLERLYEMASRGRATKEILYHLLGRSY